MILFFTNLFLLHLGGRSLISDEILDWHGLVSACNSAVIGASTTIVLSPSFRMGTYFDPTMNSTLMFEGDFPSKRDFSIKSGGGIDFSEKTLYLEGNGATLDAGGGGRFFYADGCETYKVLNQPTADCLSPKRFDSVLSIRNLTLLNGADSKWGGAIFLWHANLEIDACTLVNNSAVDIQQFVPSATLNPMGLGGAIVASSSQIKILSSVIHENKANSGGALALFGTKLTVVDSLLTANQGLWYPAHAIQTYPGSYIEITMKVSAIQV
jgi:hypothetical protein